jgi:hypothetical protein
MKLWLLMKSLHAGGHVKALEALYGYPEKPAEPSTMPMP